MDEKWKLASWFIALGCVYFYILQGSHGEIIGSNPYLLIHDGKSPAHGDQTAIHNVTYLSNAHQMCLAEDDIVKAPYLIVLVHSTPENKANRDAIRDTWGKITKDYNLINQVRLVFLVGLSSQTSSAERLQKIRRETKLYRDIVIIDMLDTYRNLTLKSLAGLQWILQFCNQVKYVLKTDDDVYFRVDTLLHHLSDHQVSRTSPLILGSLNQNALVMRQGVWRVDFEDYPNTTYPPYCSGNSYLMCRSAVHAIMHKSVLQNVSLIPMEDVYITGLLAAAAGLRCHHNTGFPYWITGPNKVNVMNLQQGNLFAVHNVPYEKMYEVHNVLKNRDTARY